MKKFIFLLILLVSSPAWASSTITINPVTGDLDLVGSGGGDTITSPNSTLTVGGTSSNTTLDIALGHANTWTGLQIFGTSAPSAPGANTDDEQWGLGAAAGNAIGTDNEAFGAGAVAGTTSTRSRTLAIGPGATANISNTIAIGAGATTTAQFQMVVGSSANSIRDTFLGGGVTSSTLSAAYAAIHPTGGSGTDKTGWDMYLDGGRGTGTGHGGSIFFQTALHGTTGTTAGTLATVGSFDESGNFNIPGLTASSAVATDSSKNLVSVTNTGTGDNVLATSPTLITPVLGVATATSVNKMAITAPATSSTLAVADGKTFTASNTMTLSGTDSVTMNVSNNKIAVIGITIDGGGSAITTGVKGYITCPYAGTIASATLIGDQTGSMVVDVWKTTFSTSAFPTVANTITASALPTISSTKAAQDTTLTGWTTSVTAGDEFGFNVNSCSTITRATLILKITKT